MSEPTPLDRMWLAFRQLVRGELDELRFLGAYTYVVRGSVLGTVDAEPATTTLGLPSLLRVRMLSGVTGDTAIATSGQECVIVFLDGDPTRPRVLSIAGVEEARIAGGTSLVALASLVASELATHTHTGVTAGAGVTGPAVAIGNVAATKVKAV
jgi:hypothetical protein